MTDSQRNQSARHSARPNSVPPVSSLLFRGFAWYSRRLVSKSFHAVRIASGTAPTLAADEAALVYLNHASWWDPLIAVLVNDCLLAPRTFYAPMDHDALQQYAIMRRLGFFPVQQQSSVGIRDFLQTARSILAERTSLFITPEGQFVDVREDRAFEPGLAHLVSRLPPEARVAVLPMAVEYTFWNESTPEVLIEFGNVQRIAAEAAITTKRAWSLRLQSALRSAQRSLAVKGIARDASAFDALIDGRTGEGGLYDAMRRFKSWLSGRRFEAAHDHAAPHTSGVRP